MTALRTAPLFALLGALAGCPTAPPPDPIPPSPKVISFTASPTAIEPGTPVTLTWEVQDATSVTISDVNQGAASGVDNRLSGTLEVSPADSTLYVLTAANERGARATAFVSVKVAAAPNANDLILSAWPPVLAPAETGTLLWTAPGARTVTITPSNGAPLDLMGQVQSGSVSIDPASAETSYTLDADGLTRTVTVTRLPSIDQLTASKTAARPGETVTVSWKTRFTAKVTISVPGIGVLHETTAPAELAQGSFAHVVPALADGTILNYRLDAEGPGGTARQTVPVLVGVDPSVLEVNAPPYAKVGQDFALSWKAANADVVRVIAGGTVLYETTTAPQVAQGQVRLPTPASATTYTVTAIALQSGKSASKDVTVDAVGDTQLDLFTATPGTVATGGSAVTLQWNVPNARRLRIEQDDQLTVVWLTGPAAASGTATAYANRAGTRFKLTADNMLDAPLTATADVTVTTPVQLSQVDGGLVYQSQGNVDLALPVGSEIHGLPHSNVDLLSTSGFVDISTTGTALSFTGSQDQGYAEFTAEGFETTLYGSRLGTGIISACTNGFLSLRRNTLFPTSPSSAYPGINTTYNLTIAPFWSNLELGPQGNVFWEVRGEAPNRVLIVQWDRVRIVGAPYSELTFQAQLSQAGVVTFEYRTLSNFPMVYAQTIGLQTTSGRGVGFTGTPAAGTGLRFFGPRAAPVTVSAARLPMSGFVKLGTGFTNVPLTRFVKAGELAIAEVMYATGPLVPAGEWIEVRNASKRPLDLAGFELDFGGGNVHTIAGNAVVPAEGTLVLGQTTDTAQNDGVAVGYAYGTSFLLNDFTGSVTLRSGSFATQASWTPAGPGANGVAGVFDPTKVVTSATGSTLTERPCAGTQPYGTQTPQQRGTPGVNTSCRGYLLLPIDGAFEDVASPTTFVALQPVNVIALPTDEGLASIDVSAAPIVLFGTPTNTLTVSSNGWILPRAFTSTTNAGPSNKVRPDSSTLPTSGLIIAPFWDDLDFTGRSASGVYVKRFAAGASAVEPRPHWIVEWKGVSHYPARTHNDSLDFEVKFFDSGVVEYHYGVMQSGSDQDYASGLSATIWLENPAGTEALAHSVNTATVNTSTATPGMGLRFLRTP